MTNRSKPNKNLQAAYHHEALDRTYCVYEMAALLLSTHPGYAVSAKAKKLMRAGVKNLWDAYQELGSKIL